MFLCPDSGKLREGTSGPAPLTLVWADAVKEVGELAAQQGQNIRRIFYGRRDQFGLVLSGVCGM